MSEETLKVKISKHVSNMRQTLKARVIPNLPLSKEVTQSRDCETRDWVGESIDKFEFEYYLQEMVDEVLKKIEKAMTKKYSSDREPELLEMSFKDWEEMKKELK